MSFSAELAQVIEKILPTIEIVHSHERGVLYRRGVVDRTPLKPDFYWNLPGGYRRVVPVPIMPQWIDLPFQSLETADGVAVAFSLNVGFRIIEPVVWHNDVQDAEQTMMNFIRPVAADIVTATGFEVMRGHLAGTAKRIARRLRPQVVAIGAELEGVGFTDFIRARHYRLLQDVSP